MEGRGLSAKQNSAFWPIHASLSSAHAYLIILDHTKGKVWKGTANLPAKTSIEGKFSFLLLDSKLDLGGFCVRISSEKVLW